MLPRQYEPRKAGAPGDHPKAPSGKVRGEISPISQAEAARRLGVCKYHLNRVLRGHRKSKRLLARYHAAISAA